MEIEMHQCPQCPCEFEWKFQTDHHVQREHTLVYAAELFHAIVEPEQFSCIYCSFKSNMNIMLWKHYKQHHGRIDESNMKQSLFCDEAAGKYPCNLCRYNSDSHLCPVDSCETIVRPSKEDSIPDADNETSASNFNVFDLDWQTKYFHCANCLYKSKWKGCLKRHMVTHASSDAINWFQCVKCTYKGKQKQDLNKHMLIHASIDDIDWFQCAKCLFKSKQKTHLRRHMIKHASNDDIDWFQCAKCSYKCKRKWNLRKHVMTHASSDDIVWFQCAKCSYKSKWKDALKTHMVTHASSDDIDWFRCAKCSFKSKQKWNLRKHMMTHASSDDRLV